MKDKRTVSTVLWYQTFGFGLLIALSWANEIVGLPQLVFGGEYAPNWRESAIETIMILLVACPLILVTKRLLARLQFLEEFLRVCSWCKMVNEDDKWQSLEDYFESNLAIKTSHGICPTCMAKMMEQVPVKQDGNEASGPQGRVRSGTCK